MNPKRQHAAGPNQSHRWREQNANGPPMFAVDLEKPQVTQQKQGMCAADCITIPNARPPQRFPRTIPENPPAAHAVPAQAGDRPGARPE